MCSTRFPLLFLCLLNCVPTVPRFATNPHSNYQIPIVCENLVYRCCPYILGASSISSKTCPQDDRYESCPDSLVGALHLLCLTPHIYTVRPKTAFTCITVFYLQTYGVSQTLLERHHLYCGVTLSPLLIAIELCCLEDMIGAPTAMRHIYWTWSHG